MLSHPKAYAMHRTKAILLALMQTAAIAATAQQPDTISGIVSIPDKNKVVFQAPQRPLRGIAGAPQPFYTYFWEFGDGKFSFEQQPLHVYKDTGTYNVLLYATNNYDDGKPPPRRRKKVPVKEKVHYALQRNNSLFKKDGAIEMRVNRQPSPGQEMVLVIGYRNIHSSTPVNGSLVLFYNERQFRPGNFEILEERPYNSEQTSTLSAVAHTRSEIIQTGETSILSGPNINEASLQHQTYAGRFADLLQLKQKQFRQTNVWKFQGLEEGEEKYFFLTLHTAPGMIKDTNAVVLITGMFVPDDEAIGLEEFELELQIVASHDPNRILLRNRRLNYRFTGTNKEMTYSVRFQNTGKGAASNISIGIAIPRMLNAASLQLLDHYPGCVPCDIAEEGQSCLDTLITPDSIHFIFKNIYLPGLRQEGFSDPDSTMGFIKYLLQFERKIKKLPFESNAVIVFDKNEPVRTNTAKGYFIPGNSAGIIIGYNKWFSGSAERRTAIDYWMAGISYSSYAPFKKYLQWEIFISSNSQPEQLIRRGTGRDTTINGQLYFQQNIDVYEKQMTTKLHIVPLQLRYNIFDWCGAGIGSMVSTDAVSKTTSRREILLTGMNPPPFVIAQKLPRKTDYFTNWDVALFGDVQLGKVRAGPAFGLRLLHYFIEPENRWMAYAIWRL